MSHLGDDAEAFFQQGDDGTYDGGPLSLSPSTRDAAHEADDLTTELTAGVLERRDRFQRLVKRVVGTLGACVLVLLPFRLGIANGSGTATAATETDLGPASGAPATPAAVELSAPPAETAAPAVAPAPAAVPVAAEGRPASIAGATRAPNARVQRHTPSLARHAIAHAATGPTHGAVRTAQPAANAPLRTGGSRRASAVHVPPTASFPD